MNCLCFLISPCKLILVLMIVKLNNMICVKLIMLIYIYVLYINMDILEIGIMHSI